MILLDHVTEASHTQGWHFLLMGSFVLVSTQNGVLGMISVPSRVVFHILVMVYDWFLHYHAIVAISLAEYTGTAGYFEVKDFLFHWLVNVLKHNRAHLSYDKAVWRMFQMI